MRILKSLIACLDKGFLLLSSTNHSNEYLKTLEGKISPLSLCKGESIKERGSTWVTLKHWIVTLKEQISFKSRTRDSLHKPIEQTPHDSSWSIEPRFFSSTLHSGLGPVCRHAVSQHGNACGCYQQTGQKVNGLLSGGHRCCIPVALDGSYSQNLWQRRRDAVGDAIQPLILAGVRVPILGGVKRGLQVINTPCYGCDLWFDRRGPGWLSW